MLRDVSDRDEEDWSDLSEHLRGLLTETELADLCDAFGGIRLYVPLNLSPEHRIVKAIGVAPTERLIQAFGGCPIRVPLMRKLRARRYRQEGRSNAWIARRLGVTESGVDKLFARTRRSEA